MADVNFGILDTQAPGRIAAIPQQAQAQQTQNMLTALQAQHSMNQNELARYQLSSARRADSEAEQMRALFGGATPTSMTDPEFIRKIYAINPKEGIALEKANEERKKSRLEQTETQGKIEKQARDAVDSELTSFTKNAFRVTDVPSLTSHLRAFYNNPLLGKIAAKFKPFDQALNDDIQQISTPEGLRQWQAENANLTGQQLTDLLLKVTTSTENLGNVSRTTQRSGMGRTIGVPVDTRMGVSPNTIAQIDSARRNHLENLAQQGWTFDTERGIAVNARQGISRPISTLMAPVGGGFSTAPAVGGAPATSIAAPSIAAPGGGVPGQRQAPAGQPAAGVLGPKPEKPTDSYYSEAKGILNTNDAINNLKQVISNFTPTDMVNPARRAEIDQAHKTAVLLSKEMFKLGVLNGGDQKILEQVIPDPIAFSKGLVPIETIRKNMSSASNIVNNMNKNLSRVHKQPLLSLDTVEKNEPSPSAPPIQSFRRSD
jgi:hypothetical protein